MAVVATQFISTSDRDNRLVVTLNSLYATGAEKGWGDIHFESEMDGSMRVRARQDGIMVEIMRFSCDDATILVNKFRYRANLNVADTRHEQDGRFVQEYHGHRIDVRLSIVPTIFGVSVVTRLLDSDNSGISISKLGMSPDIERLFRESLQQNEGLILTGGPTGSGKTTTMYAAIATVNTPDKKINTAEDPVEYIQQGLQQSPVGEGTGRTFASAVRAMMRQNPDIILVGEIRDHETAKTAVQASMTGHLVLATIHANSSIETIFRLEDLGVPQHLLGNALRLSQAQRLVRSICPQCAVDQSLKDIEMFYRWRVEPPESEKVGQGCEHCHGTGYKGRIALYETFVMTRELRAAIKVGGSRNDIEEIVAKQSQYRKLFVSGCEMVATGKTNTQEILRVLSDYDE